MSQQEIDNLEREANAMLKKIFEWLRSGYFEKKKLEEELESQRDALNETKSKLKKTENELEKVKGDLKDYARRACDKIESQKAKIVELEKNLENMKEVLSETKKDLEHKTKDLEHKTNALNEEQKKIQYYEELMCKDLFKRFRSILKDIPTPLIKSDDEQLFLLTCANARNVENLRKSIMKELGKLEENTQVCEAVCGVFNEILELLKKVDPNIKPIEVKVGERFTNEMERSPKSLAQGCVHKVLLHGFNSNKPVVIVK
ncbi:hypothetical protein [Helicobacter sp.]|uniref:hypothetical protein n=1 Tax=Helicobacter sp. TaxID=218 RepID=UPI0025891F7D|nr:hypothetical protein [Helicobacter sp.]MCI7765871.1 hypothetical protein [Helicobacter sp.]